MSEAIKRYDPWDQATGMVENSVGDYVDVDAHRAAVKELTAALRLIEGVAATELHKERMANISHIARAVLKKYESEEE